MSDRDIATNIYFTLKGKGAEIGNASISIIEKVLSTELAALRAELAIREQAQRDTLAVVREFMAQVVPPVKDNGLLQKYIKVQQVLALPTERSE